MKESDKVTPSKSIAPTIIIILLLIAIVSLVGYIVYDKVFSGIKSPEVEDNGDEIKEYLDSPISMTSEEKMFFNLIEEIGFLPSYEKSNSEIVNVKTVDITNNSKLMFALRHINGDSISATEVGNALRKYFGSEITVTHGDVICDSLPTTGAVQNHIAYTYDSTMATYYLGSMENHDVYSSKYYYFIKDVVVEDDKYIVNLNILKSKPCVDCSVIKELYDDLDSKPVLRTNKSRGFDSSNYINTIGLYYQNAKDKLTTYQYVFEKTDNNYTLTSYQY